MVIGCWWLVTGHRSQVTGCWLLVAVCRFMVWSIRLDEYQVKSDDEQQNMGSTVA